MPFINDDGEPFADDRLWSMTTSNDPIERAQALHELALRAARQGRFREAIDLQSAGVSALDGAGDDRLRGRMLGTLARMNLDLGDLEAALDCATASAAVLREHTMDCELATPQRIAGLALLELDRLDEARDQTDAALRLFESCDDDDCIALCRTTLADIARRQGDPSASVAHHREAVAARRRTDDVVKTGDAVFALAIALLRDDQPSEARDLLGDLVDYWEYLDEPGRRYEATAAMGVALRATGAFAAAVGALAAGADGIKSLGRRDLAVQYDLERVHALRDLGFAAQADDLEGQVRAYQRILGLDQAATESAGGDADGLTADDESEVGR